MASIARSGNPWRVAAAAVAFLHVALLLAVAVCPAQAQVDRSTSAARALFQEGLRLVDAGHWEEARDRFERAFALRPSALVRFNLAAASARTQRLVEAIEHFEGVRRDPTAPASARAASAVELARLRAAIGRLVVHVRGASDDVTVRLDGRPMSNALFDVGAPADPGQHVALAERDGEVVARGVVEVRGGETAELTLSVPARPRPRALTRPRPLLLPPRDVDDGEQSASAWPWVGVALGATAVVATTVIVVLLLQPSSDAWNGDTSPGTLRW